MTSNWLAPQHSPESAAPELEEGTAEDLLAERVESVIWHVFRNASRHQVEQVTAELRRIAIAYAESWAESTPRRQRDQLPY